MRRVLAALAVLLALVAGAARSHAGALPGGPAGGRTVAGRRRAVRMLEAAMYRDVDFEVGRYAFCKVTMRPGEGGLTRRSVSAAPRACGGADAGSGRR